MPYTKRKFGLFFTLLAWLLASEPAFAQAGEVVFVFGDASLQQRDGQRKALETGMSLSSGDVVLTAVNGRVQIRMADGGLIALRPGSELLIEEFHYSSGGDQSAGGMHGDRSFFKLLKGGLRSITGAVGQTEKEAYRVETPVATIGIRGTDYIAYLCDADCAAQGLLSAGLHVAVNQGGVRVSNRAGSVDIDAGQAAVVDSADDTPRLNPDPGPVFQVLDELQMPFPQAIHHLPGATGNSAFAAASGSPPSESSVAGGSLGGAGMMLDPELAAASPAGADGTLPGESSAVQGISGTGGAGSVPGEAPGAANVGNGPAPGANPSNFFVGPDGVPAEQDGIDLSAPVPGLEGMPVALASFATDSGGFSIELSAGLGPDGTVPGGGVAGGDTGTGGTGTGDTGTGGTGTGDTGTGGTGTGDTGTGGTGTGDTGTGGTGTGDTGTGGTGTGDTGTGGTGTGDTGTGTAGQAAAAVFAHSGTAFGELEAGTLTSVGASYTLDGRDALIRASGEWDRDGILLVGGQIERGTARNLDLGGDSETSIRWGRWASGHINISGDLAGEVHPVLGAGGMHWIVRDDSLPVPALPSTGSAYFDLVGGTAPTDNHGQTGVLGSAILLANFDTSTVDASLSLTTPDASGQLQWEASAEGMALDTVNATFADAFDSVTVSGADGTAEGSGWVSGFFTGDATGELNGAGLGYNLSDGNDTSVSGTAAFRLRQPGH